MRVLFVHSQIDQKLSKNNKQIASLLESLGNKIVVGNVDASGLNNTQLEKDYQKMIASLKKIDIVVIEASIPSSGIGFLVASAINEKKPVLALIDSKSQKNNEAFWNFALKSKFVSFTEYEPKKLEQILTEYLNKVKKTIDTKFILIISPEIDTYLQWASDNRRMHKAQVVRRAVEEVMREDKEYKKFNTNNKTK